MPAVSTANPVDTLRLSQASPVLPASAPPLTQRGANQTWNYSSLVATSQSVDRYVAVSATAPIYQFAFGALGGVNRATVASPEPLPAGSGAVVPITDPYQFYSVSAATAPVQDFRSVGFGGTLAGFQVPLTYRSQAEQDIIYRFPLSYASQPDSSQSFFETPAAAASTGYLNRRRKRVNRVDAWGTLITPFGTFQTVRVVTKLIDHDSIAIGGLTRHGVRRARDPRVQVAGQNPPRAGAHHHHPGNHGGTETITVVQYRDIYRRFTPLATRDAATDAALAAYPNPSRAGSALTLSIPARQRALTVSATDVVGRQLFRRSFDGHRARLIIGADAFGSFRGLLLLTVTTARGTATRRLVRE